MKTRILFSVEVVDDSPFGNDCGEVQWSIRIANLEGYLRLHGAAGMKALRDVAALALDHIDQDYLPVEETFA